MVLALWLGTLAEDRAEACFAHCSVVAEPRQGEDETRDLHPAADEELLVLAQECSWEGRRRIVDVVRKLAVAEEFCCCSIRSSCFFHCSGGCFLSESRTWNAAWLRPLSAAS
eukprot:713067-Rhodomonas_salina.2